MLSSTSSATQFKFVSTDSIILSGTHVDVTRNTLFYSQVLAVNANMICFFELVFKIYNIIELFMN